MSGILHLRDRPQSGAALHIAAHATCTAVVDVIFIHRMLLLSLSQHAAALPRYPPTPLIPFPCHPLAAYCHYLAFPPALLMHSLRGRFPGALLNV